MSWLFSRALVAEYSAATCWDGAQSAPSSGNPTPLAYLQPDKMTDFCRRSLSGMTLEPLTADRGAELLTWFLAAFPVRTFQSPDTAPASMASAQGSGQKWHESLAKYDPALCSWKTPQRSLLGDSDEFSGTWPRWGFMLDGECWELEPSIRYVKGSESGLSLLRPTAQCWKAWTFKSISSLVRRNHADGNIQEQSARCFSRMITPLSNEILMKWPEGWTDLRPLETAKFREWQQQHSESFPGNEAAA